MIGTVSYRPGSPLVSPLSRVSSRTALSPLTRKELRRVSWRASKIPLLVQVSFVKLLCYEPQGLISDTRAMSGAPKNRRRSDLRRKSVEEAIGWLNSPSRAHPDKTRIELYLEKRTAHGKSIKHKDDSYKQALETTKHDPRNESPGDQQAAYNRWVAGNNKRLSAAVQAAHMDWVTTANKTDVEYHLCIIDLDLDKAVKKVLESRVNTFFASFANNTDSSDVTGSAYIGVVRAH